MGRFRAQDHSDCQGQSERRARGRPDWLGRRAHQDDRHRERQDRRECRGRLDGRVHRLPVHPFPGRQALEPSA